MRTPEATGRITVITTPSGEAPEEVRKAWVGLTLPCYPVSQTSNLLMGVVSRGIRRERKEVVIVPQIDALAILAEHRPEAARWWRDNGYPMVTIRSFTFDLSAVSIVSGVRPQQITEVTDEMRSDPNR